MVYLSTDLVFDCKSGGYAETDRPQPSSVYGRTKYEGEQMALAEVPGAAAQSLRPLRALARLSSEVRALPHLLPRPLAQRDDPRRAKGQLVAFAPGEAATAAAWWTNVVR